MHLSIRPAHTKKGSWLVQASIPSLSSEASNDVARRLSEEAYTEFR
jgi:hypothetical protein